MRRSPIMLAAAAMIAATAASGAVLQRCPAGPDNAAGQDGVLTLPDGRRQRVFVGEGEAASGCNSMRLPVPASAVLAVKPLVPALADRLDEGVLLQGTERDSGFRIGSALATGPEPSPGRLPMPWHDNLLARMTVRPFGAEERVRAQRVGDRLQLRCTPGNKPAGVILGAPWSLSEAHLALQLRGGGTGRFEVQALDAGGVAREAPTVLGQFDVATAGSAAFVLPRGKFDRAGWQAFAIACPSHAAQLSLDSLSLAPQAMPGPPPARAAWVWDAHDWQERPAQVFAHAGRYGIKTLFMTVPVVNGKVVNPDALASFVRDAAGRGIDVWSVDGDPQMVLPGEQAAALARVRAYAGYNARMPPEARLRGMQFDIEHYLVPGYALAERDWDRRYVQLARALHAAAPQLPLEFVVPFWWSEKADLLRGIVPYASGLTVMDYRTDPQEILRFAIPFLDWGARHGKKVRIALEAGPVAAEQQRRYVRNEAGQLWLVRLEQAPAPLPVLVLLADARPNPFGPAYRETARREIDGTATSFHADPQRLLDALPRLEADFIAWPAAFGGMALHELK